MSAKKILAILPSDVFYGKERANFEVYKLLNSQKSVNLKIIINKNAEARIKKHSQRYNTLKLTFPNRHSIRFRFIIYFSELLISNIQLLIYLLTFRPHYIFMNSEVSFYDFFIPLSLSRAKIIYRIGDAPAFTKLSNYAYNSYAWKKLVCKKVDTIICVSNFIIKKVQETGRVSNKDQVIYSYPPCRDKKKPNNSIATRQNKFNIGYIGQISQEKGVDLMLMAAINILKERRDVSFFFAGSLEYNSDFSKNIFETRSLSPLKENIHFLGEIDDVNHFFANINVLCIPSIKEEPLANVLVEAKNNAKPCIIFRSGGLPELINHKHDGFICKSKTKESIIEGINYYINQPTIISRHGKNSFESINSLGIDYDNYKRKWLSIFKINS